MNNQMKYGLIGLFVGGIAVWLFMSSNLNSANSGMMGFKSNSQGMMQNTSGIDAHFIEQMIPHHEDAISMAKLAQDNATRPEVKTLANNIITSQSSEISQMKQWYRSWFGKEVEQNESAGMGRGMMRGGIMGDGSDIEELESAVDLDKAFIEEMIPHHQMAVMMATMLRNGTARPEMKQLAENIITAQTSEIDQMRGWLREWDK